jgi:hypothetical protein
MVDGTDTPETGGPQPDPNENEGDQGHEGDPQSRGGPGQRRPQDPPGHHHSEDELHAPDATVEAHLEESFNLAVGEKLRSLYERNGLLDDAKQAFRMQQDPFWFDPKDIKKHNEDFQQKLQQAEAVDPELKAAQEERAEALAKDIEDLQRKQRGVADEATTADPLKETADESDEERDERVQRESAEFDAKQKKLDDEVIKALADATSNPTDVEAQKILAEKLHKAQTHHEEEGPHGAEGLMKTDPWYNYAVKTFGVLYFVAIACLWLASATAEQYGRSGNPKG